MTKTLYEQLHSYGESDYYPYHMPGHKRRSLGCVPESVLKADITEIDGFDNLHQPEDILDDLQKQAARLYGAEESFYLINGSTCGILSAISAVLPENSHLLMVRGCHKSVYHAAYIRKLKLSYLYPTQVAEFDFQEAVTAKQVKYALEEKKDIGAVLIVSPTYEGRIADVRAIAKVVHEKGIPLIVDEAHGAHLGFADGFAQNSCRQGADIVIHSVHKTLPAMTQTALLHVNGELVDRNRLRRFLHIYQTSSPSYVLMASISDAMQIIDKQGVELFATFRKRYLNMCEKLKQCRYLCFVSDNDIVSGMQDVGKLVISTRRTDVSGQWLYDRLRETYHLQCEMAAGSYCLAMFTVADTEEAYQRMINALLEIDKALTTSADYEKIAVAEKFIQPVIKFSLTEGWEREYELTEIAKAVDQPVADFINLYPPGIPLLVPGEILTQDLYKRISTYQEQKLNVQGLIKQDDKYLIPTIKQ